MILSTASRTNGASNVRGVAPRLSRKVIEVLVLLREAAEYAAQLERSRWDFAVEYSVLRRSGLNRNDCRWIVCQGWVTHAIEITSTNSCGREFQPENQLTFSKASCFTLTEKGLLLALTLMSSDDEAEPPLEEDHPGAGLGIEVGRGSPCIEPRFHCDVRELRLGDRLVKRFRLPSPNQETILLAFQEEGWPRRIDDPLPPTPYQESSHRLRETIKSLNRHQAQRLIHFGAAGDGQGILWSRCEQDL